MDVGRRLRRLSEILARELEVIQLGSKIQSEVQSEIEKGQREYYLREQLKAIQQELGEADEQQAEINELRERIEAADLPEQARKQAERELGRLERLPPAAAEYGVIRTYLEWIIELPWGVTTEDNLDIPHAREVLDADHYDLEKVKDRILEYLAVRKLNPGSQGPILCFVGPPGVGKTSLGRSIARALGREFERISVGGVRDEAEIRGHRRTYIGAMPGTIVRALRDAGSRNPVFMIDEIDKMGADFRGDPSSAMLEVLDPAQNDSFRDHYLDLPFDLSGVLFITTANTLETVMPGAPGPDGGDQPRRLHAGREAPDREALPGAAPDRAERAARGAGSRSPTPRCERSPTSTRARPGCATSSARSAPCAARSPARSPRAKAKRKVTISAKRARELLGTAPVLRRAAAPHQGHPGVATGLAWTPVGGEVLFVEATAMPGDGKLTITGPARRGDARVGAGGALLGARPPARSWRRTSREDWFADARHPRPRPGGGGPEGRPVGRRGDGDRARVARQPRSPSGRTSR